MIVEPVVYLTMMVYNIDVPMVSIEGIAPELMTLLKIAMFFYSSIAACFVVVMY